MKPINVKLNIIFAIVLVSIPIIMSLLGMVGLYWAIPNYIMLWGVLYCVCLAIGLLKGSLSGYKFDFKALKNPMVIIALCILGWILLTSLINTTFNSHLIVYLTYFLVFICVRMLDCRWKKILLNTLLVVIAISCIMGFINLYAKFMPGFNSGSLGMALQFGNPNYSSYIVVALSLVCFMKFDTAKTKFDNVFYCVIYMIYAVYSFVNGSFVAITCLIAVEVVVQIILGIKSKKFRYKMFILSLALLPICLLVELIPNIETIRTCRYNYLLECVAVFDNIFGTNLLSKFKFGKVAIDEIPGADGWGRKELLKVSWDRATSSPKAFIFGGGAGLFYSYRPHQGLLSLMLDFGIVMPLLFIALFVMMIVKTMKSKMNISKLILLPSIICFLMCYLTGSIVPNSFYVFMILFSLLCCDIFDDSQLCE